MVNSSKLSKLQKKEVESTEMNQSLGGTQQLGGVGGIDVYP
jgi:hypothetical protein